MPVWPFKGRAFSPPFFYRRRRNARLSALAIVCVRDEAIHIGRCLRDLIAEGLDVVLIDNESSDDTVAIASEFLGHGLLRIETLPWTGYFLVPAVLAKKQEIIAASRHDWVLHADADEWMRSSRDGQTLLDGMREADAEGYNCINFHELVFMPRPGQDFTTGPYTARMTTYYFFQNMYPRLLRAWRRDSGLHNIEGYGHLLDGGAVKRFPPDFFLRHYIALSQEQARQKYLGRAFPPDEIAAGKHKNRIIISERNLILKDSEFLRDLPSPASNQFDLSHPSEKHFWEW